MSFLIIILGILFSIFSTIVLGYVSIATMVGPWIAPTIVLMSQILLPKNYPHKTKTITWIQSIGAGGGIIATGIGFALPMLYFLDATAFNALLTQPWYFCSIISIITLISGALGLIIGKHLQSSFLSNNAYSFPVSILTNKVINSQAQSQQTTLLSFGIIGTLITCAFRDGIGFLRGIIAKTYFVIPSLFGREIAISIWPSLWAIGFSIGTSITIPLLIGLLAKYLIITPLAQHAQYLPFKLFDTMPIETFTIAFCSGLVICELVLNLPKYIIQLMYYSKNALDSYKKPSKTLYSYIQEIYNNTRSIINIELLCITIGAIILLKHFNFSILTIFFFLLFSSIATYSICQIGAKIGMVPFGRYSTFIVIPLLVMFSVSPIQATIICVFFNICAATASDYLFDMKTAEINGFSAKRVYLHQWIGLIASSLCIGIFLLLLFTHLELGTEALFAQRGKAKALLLQSLHFDKYILSLGILFGWILKKCKINATMVFGGLIMPNSVSIGLILGSLITKLTKHIDNLQTIGAGMLAAESIWILTSILINALSK